jgi:hypothetical protein
MPALGINRMVSKGKRDGESVHNVFSKEFPHFVGPFLG